MSNEINYGELPFCVVIENHDIPVNTGLIGKIIYGIKKIFPLFLQNKARMNAESPVFMRVFYIPELLKQSLIIVFNMIKSAKMQHMQHKISPKIYAKYSSS